MSRNFLVSESLKDTLTKDILYDQVCDKVLPNIIELRNCKDKIELDILDTNFKLKEHIFLSEFNIENITYKLNNSLKFNLKRIYRSKDNLLMSTIVINSKDFWSNLI